MISNDVLKFLIKSEGAEKKPYLDVAGIPTIGIGATYYQDGTRVKMTDPPLSDSQMMDLVRFHLTYFEDGVKGLVTAALNNNQLAALTLFAFGSGLGNLKKSSLLKVVNNNPNDPLIDAKLKEWVNATVNGKLTRLENLVRRRAYESDLYFSKSDGLGFMSNWTILVPLLLFFYTVFTVSL